MQYVIITFRLVIFSDASTSGFKTELIICSWLQAFVANLIFFLEVLIRKILTRCKIVLWYRFRQNKNVKLLRCDLFCFAPSNIYLNKYCKAFQQNVLHQIKIILWFFGLKTCKGDIFLQNVNLFIKTIP